MSSNIVYGQEEDFRSKMAKFGAKLNNQKNQGYGRGPPKKNYGGNNLSDYKPMQQGGGLPKPSGGYGQGGARPPRKQLVKSKAARQMGRNEDAIKVNLDSVKAKVKFGRLVVYSVNCLANLAENKYNCEFIVEQGGIEAMKEVMKHHSGNPAMKEVSRTLKNVAEAGPHNAEKIVNDGMLEQCMNTLTSHPNECGVFALDIMDSVLKSSDNPKAVAQRIVKNGGLKVLESALKKYPNNPDLCESIIKHMNALMAADPSITRQLGDRAIWQPILDAMKAHPEHGGLAIQGTDALQKLAIANPNYLKGIQNSGAVGIISACMQANPDLKGLTRSGAAALKLLAGQDDVSRALAVLLDFGKYDDIMITQALGLLGNLALISENAQFIVAKGGLDCLMNLINYKCKKKDLSPEEVAVVANSVRAMGRLLDDPKVAQAFANKGGLNLLKDMMEYYDHEETIMNAAVDALGNLAGTQPGKEYLAGSGAVETATNVICKHPEYDILMQKYGDLLSNLPLTTNPEMLKQLLNAGLLQGVQQSLLTNYEDPETVKSIMDIIKQIVQADPKLAQGLANQNARGFIQAIRAHQDNPEVLAKILDAVHAIGVADPEALKYLKKVGLDDELVKILKQENISDETAAVIKEFLDNVKQDDVDVDLTNVLLGLKGLGMPLDELAKSVQEVEVKNEPEIEEIDPNAILNELKKLNGLLVNPNYAKNYIAQGNVGHILDNIQQCYDDPNIVCQALDAIINCAKVPGVFPIMEEAGVCEGVVQCMLEHPDDMAVQYKGLLALGALAAHKDPLVTESLCQPITLETALKALQKGIANPEMAETFAKLVSSLMDDQANAPQTAQALAAAGVVDALNNAMSIHPTEPRVQTSCNEALSKINPYLFNPNDIGMHSANVNPYGTVTLAQLAQMTPEELDEMCKQYDTQTLMTTMRASRDPKMVQSAAKEANARLQGGDQEIYNSIVSGGGIGDLLGQANANMGNPQPLGATLDGLGTLSSDDRLKTLLGMHGTIRLILEVMRRHPNDIELLDKCCYILSNLSFNNQQNMTAIIELAGVQDIVGVVKKHTPVNFICESAINVLVNLCHNSDKNKTLIARSGGAKATIAALKTHNKCLNDGDEAVVVSCFRCLANLAYVPDNVKQLIKLDVVAVVMDTMNQNTDKKDLIQMGVVVLANLSSHERTAARMVNLGVLDLIIRVSQSYPDELEIQRSCLGCVGNLMNEQSNAVAFLDKKGHLRVFEIMQELVFEESVITTALKLLKVLATNTDVATELTLDGGCKVVSEIMGENKSTEEILSLGCQAICKMIVTMEAARHVSKDGLCEKIVEIAKDNNNWANIQIMNELVKVVVNISSVEENAQPFARSGAVPLLRSIEAHKTNAVFLNNAAMALSKLSVHPASSRPLVKRGAIPVILASMQSNPTRKAILARYVRALTNFLYTEHKAGDELAKNNGYAIVAQLAAKHENYAALQTEMKGFEKAVKLKSKKFVPSSQQNQSIRDKLSTDVVRFLCSGTVVKKYGDKGKAKKKILKVNDDCSLLLFEDPNGQKAPKQLNLKSVKGCISGAQANGMQKCNPNNAFVIISIDPNGREFRMGMECKTNMEKDKWVKGLQTLIQAA
eukprot:222104_1